MSDTKYPEHAKLSAIREQSQTCGAFLEWLTDEKGLVLAEYLGASSSLARAHYRVSSLLAGFFEIDENVLEKEKLAMLDELRALNAKQEG